jgi:hypothetical protein
VPGVSAPHVSFFAYRSDSQITAGNTNNLIFPTTRHNDGNAYDPATGIFSAPAAGVYQFNASVMMQVEGAQSLNLYLQVNGVDCRFASSVFINQCLLLNTTTLGPFTAGFDSLVSVMSGSLTATLQAGDQVRLMTTTGSARPDSRVRETSSFSGHQVY